MYVISEVLYTLELYSYEYLADWGNVSSILMVRCGWRVDVMFWFQEEILNSIIIPVKIQSQQEDNHDPLETCDVTPAYRHLNLENETKTLESLNKAVVYWTSALQNVSLILCCL